MYVDGQLTVTNNKNLIFWPKKLFQLEWLYSTDVGSEGLMLSSLIGEQKVLLLPDITSSSVRLMNLSPGALLGLHSAAILDACTVTVFLFPSIIACGVSDYTPHFTLKKHHHQHGVTLR